MRAIVVGAAGQIGHAVCKTLLGKGHEVVAIHRGSRELQFDLRQSGCREIVGDRHRSEDVLRALSEGGDLLVDIVPMMKSDAEQLVSVSSGFASLVAISSCAVYVDDEGRSLGSARQTGYPEFPPLIKETQRTVPPDDETYAGRKVAIEHSLLERSKAPTVILRPAAVHGPFAQDLREVWFLKRLLDGRRMIPLAFNGTSQFHTTASATIAAAMIAAVSTGEHKILNVADADAPTVLQIGETLLNGHSAPKLITFPGPPRRSVGRSPWSVPRPIRLDISALTELMGTPPRYREVIGPTEAWALEQLKHEWTATFPKLAAYPFPLFDYAAEDKYLPGIIEEQGV